MTKVKITIKGTFDTRAANIDNTGRDLAFAGDVAYANLADGDHFVWWQVGGQPGSEFTVMVEPGLDEALKCTIPDSCEDAAQVPFKLPAQRKDDVTKGDAQ
ncbi:MAG: hypothetical protein Q8S73_22905 [Deltaproteobacteria bacterium]|nr:hypothetical protein [Myxococcales bacterium]MDP3216979.1 hypothetical protein [Deltaproteobacteria bacterium]